MYFLNNNQKGVTLIESMVAIAILGVSVVVSTKTFSLLLKNQVLLEKKQNNSNYYFDLFNTLSDERNCYETFKNFGAVHFASEKKESSLSDIKDASGRTVLKVQKSGGDNIHGSLSSALLTNKRVYKNYIDPSLAEDEDEFKVDAELMITFNNTNGNTISKKKINMTFLLDDDPSNFKRVKKCWASSGLFVSGPSLPACENGYITYLNKEPICSDDLPGSITNNYEKRLSCLPAGNCATLSNPKKAEFWVTNSNSKLTVDDGVQLTEFSFTAQNNGSLFLKAIIPVQYEYGLSNGAKPGYEASFNGAIWVARKGQPYFLAGVGRLYDPYSKPYGDLNGVTWGRNAGGTGFIFGHQNNIKAGNKYSILIKIFSIKGYDQINSNLAKMPSLYFGSIQKNNQYSSGFVSVKEVSGSL